MAIQTTFTTGSLTLDTTEVPEFITFSIDIESPDNNFITQASPTDNWLQTRAKRASGSVEAYCENGVQPTGVGDGSTVALVYDLEEIYKVSFTAKISNFKWTEEGLKYSFDYKSSGAVTETVGTTPA